MRICVPFVAGILIGVNNDQLRVPVAAVLSSLALVLALAVYENRPAALPKPLFAAAIDLFFILLAIFSVHLQRSSNDPSHYLNAPASGERFVGVVRDIPHDKEKTVRLDVKLLKAYRHGAWHNVNGRVFIYVRKDDTRSRVAAADVIAFRASLQEVRPPMNPGEFDYRRYLADRGVYHTSFCERADIEVIGRNAGLNAVWRIGLACKQFTLRRLRSSGISPVAASICSALLTGYDADIDRDTRDAFAHSGTLHVLSVSGLHTGLLYLALTWIFNLFDRHRRYPRLRAVVTIVILWGFALVVGFAAPVLRAVIMFTLIGAGGIYFRGRSNTLNLLLVSAFILLLYDPYFIRDVGFLLSYFAMAGLIVLQPWLSALWQPRAFMARKLWESVSASLAATIATLPLTLYFFKQFPLWFALSNLVVVPLSFVILLVAAGVVAIPVILPSVINMLVSLLTWFIGLFDNTRFGYINHINFDFADAVFLSVLIVMLAIAFRNRSAIVLLSAFAVLVLWQSVSLARYFAVAATNEIAVYEAGSRQVITVTSASQVTLMTNDPDAYRFHAEPHIISLSQSVVRRSEFNYIKAGGATVVLDSSGYLPAADFSDVGTIILCKRYRLTGGTLARFPACKKVVADGSVGVRGCREIADLCHRARVDAYCTAVNGACIIKINEAKDRR